MNPQLFSTSNRKPFGAGQTFPRVPALICATCAVIWLVAVSGQGLQRSIGETYLGRLMALRGGHPDLRSFLTHHFLHESWIHLLANLAAIWYAGRVLEPAWGPLRFSLFYGAAALSGGAMTCAAEWALWPAGEADGFRGQPISLGASSGALACLIAYTLVADDRPVLGYLSERYLIWSLSILGCAGLVLQRLTPQMSGIAVGAGLSCLMPWADQRMARWAGRRHTQQLGEAPDIHARVDQLLEKISRQGMASLSREEKSFLQNASRHFRNKS